MDKGLLFQFMRVKFREAGFAEAEIELHMQSLAERYQNKSDEEIEADIKRRGGASRIAAATVERRNTVLMADPDYRAFAESAKAAEPAGTDTDSAVAADAPTAVAPDAETEAVTEPAAQNSAAKEDEDPLAAWFSAPAEKMSNDTDVPPLFSPQETAEADTQPHADRPAVTPAAQTAQRTQTSQNTQNTQNTQSTQTVHAIPLFGESASGQTPTAQAKPAPQPQRAPVPPSPAMSDLGQTKVVQTASVEQAAKPASAPQPRAASRAYQQEQQAIWSSGARNIRDDHGASARKSAPTANDGTRPVPVHIRDRAPAQQERAIKEKSAKVEYADRGNVTWLQEKTYWGEGTEEGVKRFRITLALAAFPAAALLLAYAVLAIGLIVLLPVLMAIFVVGLVVEVAVGSLVALVAVIYGVSQLFIVVPIGMFELGLGVAAIGITMFVGILMYNIAVRLLPFLLRQFIRFQSVFKGFLQDLYYYVKGECYRR